MKSSHGIYDYQSGTEPAVYALRSTQVTTFASIVAFHEMGFRRIPVLAAKEISTMQDRNLKIVLVSDQSIRVARLKNELAGAGVSARLVLKPPNHSTAALLRRIGASKSKPNCLVLVDFTEDSVLSRRMLKNIAFGERRCRAVVGVLTAPETEELLESGEIDGGEATMFSPTEIGVLAKKLAGRACQEVLHSMSVLNQYGPILIRTQLDSQAMGGETASA